MTTYFYEIPIKSQIAGELLSLAHSINHWEKSYGFDVIEVFPEFLANDPVMSRLVKTYAFKACILRMPENTCYQWHVDAVRQVGINMLLEDAGGSHCVFAEDFSEQVFPITELKYQPNTYYVFNTQKPHMVTNFSKPRHLFSVKFEEKDSLMVFDQLQSSLQNIWN